MARGPGDITRLLREWSDGDADAFSRLMPLVYRDLSKIAARCLRRERRDHTLEATGLVHEAYVRLVRQGRAEWGDRTHFFRAAARVMRHILVDHARKRRYQKRGGGSRAPSLDEVGESAHVASPDVLAIDEALAELARVNPGYGQLVELRFFGGLTNDEIAEVLGVSPPTVGRRWRLARAWLHRYLRRGTGDAG
jgi:RNA polymerase sigma factor (TIGR02999 family)